MPGTATFSGIISLQSFLFACLCGAHVLVLRIIQVALCARFRPRAPVLTQPVFHMLRQELWQSSGGVFNVDEVLQQMVFGLEEELELRAAQAASSWPDQQPSTVSGILWESELTRMGIPSGGGRPFAVFSRRTTPRRGSAMGAVDAAADASQVAAAVPGDAAQLGPTAEGWSVPEVRLPRPQRAFLGRVGRAMLEGLQAIGKAQ